MARVFERFSLAVSVLLLMRLIDAAKNSPETNAVSELKDRDAHVAPAVKMFKKLNDSRLVEKSKEAAAITVEHLGKVAGEITDELNEISKNHANDENDLLPNIVKNYVWHPALAITKVGSRKIKNPIKNFVSDVQQEYAEELKKIPEETSDEDHLEVIARKPIAAVKATTGILRNRIGGFFEKGLRFWYSRNKVEKTTEEHEK